MRLVFIGLTLSSSWGNGHATTYRGLIRALAARGHEVLFLEADRPWYAAHRDLPAPDFCALSLYADLAGLADHARAVATADAVVVGSYVPDGIRVAAWVTRVARGARVFYDIDTPITLAALRRGDCAYLAPGQPAEFDLYLSFTGGPTLARIEREHGVVARAMYCSADPDEYRPLPLPAPARWDLSYLGTYSEDRQPALKRLLIAAARARPDLRCVVAGPQYPDCIDWPANVERIEHLAPAEHAAFYAASRWTLNVTRADMLEAGYSPSVRLFEAGACATPILSDPWPGLDGIFRVGREVAVALSAEDMLAALAWPDPRRRALGEAARARVLAEHTPAHRAAALERWIGQARDQLRAAE